MLCNARNDILFNSVNLVSMWTWYLFELGICVNLVSMWTWYLCEPCICVEMHFHRLTDNVGRVYISCIILQSVRMYMSVLSYRCSVIPPRPHPSFLSNPFAHNQINFLHLMVMLFILTSILNYHFSSSLASGRLYCKIEYKEQLS